MRQIGEHKQLNTLRKKERSSRRLYAQRLENLEGEGPSRGSHNENFSLGRD